MNTYPETIVCCVFDVFLCFVYVLYCAEEISLAEWFMKYLIGLNFVGQKLRNFLEVTKILSDEKFSPMKI